MDHAKVAGEVVDAVGGVSNISAAAHCATRLRLVIADESKINQQALDDNDDLKGTFAAGGMFQIIVGPGDVDQVYAHMVADHGVREVSKDEAKEEAEAGGNLFSRFIKMIADIFVPILPALIAGGLLMAMHSVLTAEGLFGEKSVVQMYSWLSDYDALINLVSSAAFASLPVLVGFSAAKRFGGNTYLGAAMGAAMVSPSLLSAYSMTDAVAAAKYWAYTDQSSVWNLFGLEVTKVGYQAMVIPTLVVTWIMCLIEKSLHKVLKGTADFLLTPLITLLITGFLAFVVVGPVTRELSNYLTYGINWLYTSLDNITPACRMYREEVFGPAVGIFHARDAADAVRLAPGMLEPVQTRLAARQLALPVQCQADERLGPLECVIESPTGTLIAGLEAVLDRTAQSLELSRQMAQQQRES